MKKILPIILLFTSFLSAQNEQKSIELPDFVITGKQTIEIQTARKNKPELISTLSQDFFTPQYAPEELPLLISSEPVVVMPELFSTDYFDGLVKVGVGNYTFPTGNFHLSKAFGNYLLSVGANGTKIEEYVPNSGYNNSAITLDNIIFISTKSDFLPGTQIKLNGGYSREAFKFFGSATPEFERQTSKGFGSFSVSNSYTRWVDFFADFGVSNLLFDNEGVEERIIKSNALLNVKINGLIAGGTFSYNKQILSGNLSGIDNYDFYSTEGYLKLKLANTFLLQAGIYYAANNSTSMLAPYASANISLKNGFTIFAQYKPHVNNYTVSDMLGQNIYIMPGLVDNVFSKVKADMNGTIKYEYYKYFSVGVSAGYSKVDDYLYFQDSLETGKFDVRTVSNVGDLFIQLNLLFHPEQLGYFYGDIKYQRVRDDDNRFIPYQPKYSSKLIYGYDFNFGLGIKLGYHFGYDMYTDITNSDKLKDYQNLSVGLSYKIWDSLSLTADFQNIINKSNFAWKGYKEKPFDLIVGAEYRW